MERATADLPLERSKILDIGAGVGWLYDFLSTPEKEDYFACDISQEMLRQSNIPENQRLPLPVGQLPEHWSDFDFIFALGLTTYLSTEELEQLFQNLYKQLAPQGVAIISFANKNSIDFRLRSLFRPFSKLFPKETVMGQAFKPLALTPQQLRPLYSPHFTLLKMDWLNPSIPFLHHLNPRFAACQINWLRSLLSQTFVFPFICTDFIVRFEKK